MMIKLVNVIMAQRDNASQGISEYKIQWIFQKETVDLDLNAALQTIIAQTSEGEKKL